VTPDGTVNNIYPNDDSSITTSTTTDWSGSDVIITGPSGDTVTLKDTTLAGFQQSQFHFT
jgi:hypothetical protein